MSFAPLQQTRFKDWRLAQQPLHLAAAGSSMTFIPGSFLFYAEGTQQKSDFLHDYYVRA